MVRRKGVGYTIEAFIAALTIFIFAAGTVTTPANQDWDRFQKEVAGNDLTYTLKASGHLENFIQRGETGSLQTAVNALSGNTIEVAGTVENIPLGVTSLGFHVRPGQILTVNPSTVTSGDQCHGDLEEIDQEPGTSVKKAGPSSGAYLYFADTDPRVSAGYSGSTDYDSVWVDNGTRCQFSASEGPFYLEEFFFWGDSSGTYYDLKNIAADGSSATLYRADQPVRIRNSMRKDLNGIRIPVRADTFTFSTEDLGGYDVLVFRERASLGAIDSNTDRLMDYLEDGSMLFMMDLDAGDLENGFLSRTGLKWVGMDWGKKPAGISFSAGSESQEVYTYFEGLDGDRSAVSLMPGGNISSGTETYTTDTPLLYGAGGGYDTDDWNATNMDMDITADPPAGMPESGCDSSGIRHGNFQFPGGNYDVWSTELGVCSREIWGYMIDLDGDGDVKSFNEGPYVNGDRLKVNERRYVLKRYPSFNCNGEEGACAEFVFSGSNRIETVNFRTEFPGQNIERFARMDYEDSYSQEDRRLISSVLYWLKGDRQRFGDGTQKFSTTALGSIKNDIYMPYKVFLRWEY